MMLTKIPHLRIRHIWLPMAIDSIRVFLQQFSSHFALIGISVARRTHFMASFVLVYPSSFDCKKRASGRGSHHCRQPQQSLVPCIFQNTQHQKWQRHKNELHLHTLHFWADNMHTREPEQPNGTPHNVAQIMHVSSPARIFLHTLGTPF